MSPSRAPILVAVVLAALALPAAALGQEGAPTLTEASGSRFPDRQYVLRLPSPRALEPGDVTVVENDGPVGGRVGVEPVGGATERPAREYLVTYRTLQPPDTRVAVRMSVANLPAATAGYTTPEIVVSSLDDFVDDRSADGSTAQLLLMGVLLSALGLWVVARLRRR